MKILTLKQKIILLYKKLRYLKDKYRTYKLFKDTLGMYESSGDYSVVNTIGYMGKYQFGMARLCDLGYTGRIAGTTNYKHSSFRWVAGLSQELFLYSPKLQEEAFDKHFEMWKDYITRKYNHRIGDVVNGVELTVATMFIACHFGGAGGLSSVIMGQNPHDTYGGGTVEYMKKFEHFDLL